MRGDEASVVDAFLRMARWSRVTSVEREIAHVDVVAARGDEKLFAEAKGRTGASMGLDVDTMYGQLLRRMPPEEVGHADFAVVVPDAARVSVQRVPERVRRILRSHIYLVSEAGQVTYVGTGPDPVASAAA
jgi:hypothetical protein